MKRLFCALKVPYSEAIAQVMDSYKQALDGEAIRWVDPNNLHITLKFFGDTPNKAVKGISQALHQAAALHAPFSFQLEGMGTFGSTRFPKVIWMGISDAGALPELFREVNHQLEPLGYEPDKRIFSPHLTLGRIKELKDLNALNEVESEYADDSFNKIEVSRFYLIESFLHPHGPEYKVLEAYDLGEGHRA